jgi:hemerythrin
MDIIPWQEEFSVSVREIDMQHKNLVRMINDLYTAMTERRGQEALDKIVTGMVDYARIHFATEEHYMLKYDYIGYAAHKAEHDKFAAKAVDLQERLNERTLVLSLEVINFLKDWLSSHILATDKKYVPCFRSKGLQ